MTSPSPQFEQSLGFYTGKTMYAHVCPTCKAETGWVPHAIRWRGEGAEMHMRCPNGHDHWFPVSGPITVTRTYTAPGEVWDEY